MIDLSTEYLGIPLKNPLVPSSSPLTGNLDDAKKLEDADAAALVLPSLFEETIEKEQKELEQFVHSQSLGMFEAESFHPIPDEYNSELDNYLDLIESCKSSLDIPVIASLNCYSNAGWIGYSQELEKAGADALELNVYYVAADPNQSGQEIEQKYISLLTHLKNQVALPVTMKLSPQFSSVAHISRQLQEAGAHGISIFNRFYQPDIDLETLEIVPRLSLSGPNEALLRIRWIALLRARLEMSIAATGGFHNADDILKAILAGADIVHLCSVLLQQGAQKITALLKEITAWMEEYEYHSIKQMKASVSQYCAINPAEYEHANYMEVLRSYKN